MRLEIEVHHREDPYHRASLSLLVERIVQMSAALDALTAQVQQNNTVMGSAVTLIQGLKTQLDAAIAQLQSTGDDAALQALSASLATADQSLADAIAANTPAAPAAPADPAATPAT